MTVCHKMQDVTHKQFSYFRVTNTENQREKNGRIDKKYSAIDRCPIRNVISHFSSKWGILILLVLGEAEKLRFNEIYKILPDISPKVLSSTLKSLEQDKLVTRTIYATIPPKVEYRISEDGRTLLPILQELSQWGLMKMAKE